MGYRIKGRGVGALPVGVLDTSGLTLSGAQPLSEATTLAALDALPPIGIQPVNLIDYASTAVSGFNVNWGLVAVAGGIFLLALVLPGGRR